MIDVSIIVTDQEIIRAVQVTDSFVKLLDTSGHPSLQYLGI